MSKLIIAKDLIKAFMAGNSALIKNLRTRYSLINRLQTRYSPNNHPSTISRLFSSSLLTEIPASSPVLSSESYLISRAVQDAQLSYDELLALRTVAADFRQYLPFLIGFSIPLLGYAVPIIAALNPALLPPAFWREVTRVKQTKAAADRAQQGLSQWRAFAKDFPAPLALRELTLKASDGQMTPADYRLLDDSLPLRFSELECAHQRALAGSLALPTSLSDPPAALLEDYSLSLRYADVLLRRELQGTETLYSEIKLNDILLRRNFPVVVTTSKESPDSQHISQSQASQLLNTWLEIPITKLTSYPHASILHQINSSVVKK